ncbi:oligosaccharide transferase subunit 1 [Acrasis kona]|uniref:Dolichyl-diphosphooligosaccharide--protein glycosyltransferase subunit 1 n=1 Tax=Acrasis kona TaxID=1008807 RepID=A0AAW2YJW9_9EUKA
MMKYIFLIIVCLVALSNSSEINNDLLIENLERSIDASNNNVVKQDVRLTLVNQGSSPAQTFHFALPKTFADQHLSLLTVKQDGKSLTTSAGYTNSAEKDSLFYEVPLVTSLQPKQKITLNIEIALVNKIIVAYPSQIEQQENQKVLYSDNIYFYSPYKVKSQRTRVNVGTTQVESYTERSSQNVAGTISYGPYAEQTPFTNSPFKIHFVNNKPFVVVTSVERIVEVSHWGNLAIEEHYDLRHDGAKLKGAFSRYDYSKNPYQTSPSSFRELTAKLPLQASDIYFRDRIGNISSSNCRPSGKDLLVDFLPRFPLFGGWRIRFYIGWNLPIQNYLSNTNEQFKLKTRLQRSVRLCHRRRFDHQGHLAGGRTQRETKRSIQSGQSTFGGDENLSPHHAQDFTVTYDFTYSSLSGEPLMVIGALLCFCLFVIAYTRFNLTIRESDIVKTEQGAVRVQELTEQFVEAQQARDSKYAQIESSLSSSSQEALDSVLSAVKSAREELDQSIQRNILVPFKEFAALGQSATTRALEIIQQVERREKDRFEAARALVANKKRHLEQKTKTTADAMAESTKLFDQLGDEIYLFIQDLKEL